MTASCGPSRSPVPSGSLDSTRVPRASSGRGSPAKFTATWIRSSRSQASTSGPASTVRWLPLWSSGSSRRSAAARRNNESEERRSSACSRALYASSTGSQASPEVKPAPGPGSHGIGVRAGSRPSTSTTRSGGISVSGSPSSWPW